MLASEFIDRRERTFRAHSRGILSWDACCFAMRKLYEEAACDNHSDDDGVTLDSYNAWERLQWKNSNA